MFNILIGIVLTVGILLLVTIIFMALFEKNISDFPKKLVATLGLVIVIEIILMALIAIIGIWKILI